MLIACGLDVETSGFSRAKGAEVLELAAVLLNIERGTVVARHSTLVRPSDLNESFGERRKKALAVNKINPADLWHAPRWAQVVPTFRRIVKDVTVFVAHNWAFDSKWCLDFTPDLLKLVDTMTEHRQKFGRLINLRDLAKHYELPAPTHRASDDAECCVKIAWKGKFLRKYR